LFLDEPHKIIIFVDEGNERSNSANRH